MTSVFSRHVCVWSVSEKEHLTRQQQLLNKTLGLDGGIELTNVGDELLREEDLIVEPSSVHTSSSQVYHVHVAASH